MPDDDLAQLAGQTRQVYQRNAQLYDEMRPQALIERPWLDRLCADAPQGGAILDLGCGTGRPIAAHLLQMGYRVVGVDAAENMLEIARAVLPEGEWRLGDMRDLDDSLQGPFDAIIGWTSFFHLTRDEQRVALPRIATLLAPGGRLLLTVGPEDGEVDGHVGEDRVYHASLSENEYRDLLGTNGVQIESFVREDPDCYQMTVLLAVRAA